MPIVDPVYVLTIALHVTMTIAPSSLFASELADHTTREALSS